MSKLTPKQYLDSIKLIKELATKDVASFLMYNNKDYQKPKHLQPIIDEIDLICNGAVSKMMFSVPPQHYKSVSLLNAVALYLTKYPHKVVAYISYSQTFSQTQTRKAVQIFKHFNPNAKILIDTQKEFILDKLEEHRQRLLKYPLRMEPNIKDGYGGIRESNMMYWMANILYGVTNTKDLIGKQFTEEEYKKYRQA